MLRIVYEDSCISYKMPAKAKEEGTSPGPDQTAM